MAKLRANGMALAYELVGDRGSAVVLLHGVGSDRSVWREQLEDLEQDHRAVALDFRGHGESDLPQGPVDRAALAADVLALLDGLDIGAAHLVGLSMGGIVALETYRTCPGRVLSLTLADTFARFPGR
ncbi:MAG: alpha/beta fold hydrolase [Chloroflexota bacterium]|nr:alpha/beta fold hydrolase [Chloroflexota bacterium]